MELTEDIYEIAEGYKAFTIEKGTKVQIVKRKAKPTYQGNRCRDCIYCVRGTYLFSPNQWWESECCKKKPKTVGGQLNYFYSTVSNRHACEMFKGKEEESK
jgi:hypothetical protein